jgi:transcriptional regulator with XRE-family HTH domain
VCWTGLALVQPGFPAEDSAHEANLCQYRRSAKIPATDSWDRRCHLAILGAAGPCVVPRPVDERADDRLPTASAIVKHGFRLMAKGTFGERLRRERELRDVPVDELTKATRISQRFLEALENEDWGKLPGGVFGRGFVRTIARYLGLDEESLLAEYDAARADLSQGAATDKPEERIPSPPRWIPVAALLALLAVLTGLVYAGRYAWRRYSVRHAKQQSSASSAPLNGGVSVSRDAPRGESPPCCWS